MRQGEKMGGAEHGDDKRNDRDAVDRGEMNVRCHDEPAFQRVEVLIPLFSQKSSRSETQTRPRLV